MASFLNPQKSEQEESHWLSVSDLMAGLMMVFLFIAVALMRQAFIERDKIKEVAIAYQENQVAIYDALMGEFEKDLTSWDAVIDQDSLTFTFRSPDVLFEEGSQNLSDTYKVLLNDFFPRYMSVLEEFQSSINEVRIEGHTSSVWNKDTPDTTAYFNNMALSQGRTRAVLAYVYDIPDVVSYQPWIKQNIAAVGLSSSKLVLNTDGSENEEFSRRVTFRVITNADIKMRQILEAD